MLRGLNALHKAGDSIGYSYRNLGRGWYRIAIGEHVKTLRNNEKDLLQWLTTIPTPSRRAPSITSV